MSSQIQQDNLQSDLAVPIPGSPNPSAISAGRPATPIPRVTIAMACEDVEDINSLTRKDSQMTIPHQLPASSLNPVGFAVFRSSSTSASDLSLDDREFSSSSSSSKKSGGVFSKWFGKNNNKDAANQNTQVDVDEAISKLLAQGKGRGGMLSVSASSSFHDVDQISSSASSQSKLASPDSFCLEQSEIIQLIRRAREIVLAQPILLKLPAPIYIAGDIHGQYEDLLRWFEVCGHPSESKPFLFLGDYVDRGKKSLETIMLLMCYKIKYPNSIHLLRGNHETAGISKVYGFYDECKRRLNVKTWKTFTDFFDCLPLAAVIANKIFCVHGGISPALPKYKKITEINRPVDVPDHGVITDLLWADPGDNENVDWAENVRGVSFVFNKNALNTFLKENDLDLVVRAHMVVADGYLFWNQQKLVTVFSAPNYCGQLDNQGAIMCVNEKLLCNFKILAPAGGKKSDRVSTSALDNANLI